TPIPDAPSVVVPTVPVNQPQTSIPEKVPSVAVSPEPVQAPAPNFPKNPGDVIILPNGKN
ncbi:MAG: hypothetical protein ACRCXZ_08405, partial [Patescibacteria group bacterium]